MLQSLIKKNIFAICMVASLCFHCFCLACLQKHSLWHASLFSKSTANDSSKNLDLIQKNQILKESFASFSTDQQKEPISQTTAPNPSSPQLALRDAVEKLVLETLELPPIEKYLPTPNRLPDSLVQIAPPLLSLPAIAPQANFTNLPNHLIAPTIAAPSREEKCNASLIPQTTLRFSSSLAALQPPLPSPSSEKNIPETLPVLAPKPSFAKPPFSPRSFSQQPPLPSLPSLPTLDDLKTISCSEHFETEITFLPLENEEGYLFSVTLIPGPSLDLPKIRQHYSFLIDRSNSIQQERLLTVKKSVLKAIKDLSWDDSFNIISFDGKIDKLYTMPMPATSSAVQAAKSFLDRIELGSFFSQANLYKPLLLPIPPSSDDSDLHTAILLTDGESLGKKSAQYELGAQWSAYNQGRVSLFAIGLGSDSHLETLDAAASFNRGKLLYSPTQRGIRRKLLKLMKTISHPVAKNISSRAIPTAFPVEVTLTPPLHQAPHLYKTEPYVILGKAKTLDSFVLFVQGKLNHKWLNIKKTIDFSNAKKGTPALKTQWALQSSYRMYETYFYDHDPQHLAEAENLLRPHNIRTAFQ